MYKIEHKLTLAYVRHTCWPHMMCLRWHCYNFLGSVCFFAKSNSFVLILSRDLKPENILLDHEVRIPVFSVIYNKQYITTIPTITLNIPGWPCSYFFKLNIILTLDNICIIWLLTVVARTTAPECWLQIHYIRP